METTGRRLFLTYCSQCHASTGKGAGKGFPNLTDGDWLYGGDLATIKTSIEEGRAGMMTPLGAVLNEEERRQVANYVRQLAGESADAALAAKGKEIFLGKGTCTTCHGQNGTGMKETGWPGAPNLTDNVWLYGSDEKTIMEGIEKGRNAGEGSLTNNMQPWKGFLSEGKINLLTAYVYSLSQKK
jgi:cytochrome c oxidase cbb3-type subunit 3